MSDNNEEVTRRISESAQPIKLTTKVKRGSEVRNEDTIKVKVSGENPKETAQKLNDVLKEISDVPKELRNVQPDMEE